MKIKKILLSLAVMFMVSGNLVFATADVVVKIPYIETNRADEYFFNPLGAGDIKLKEVYLDEGLIKDRFNLTSKEFEISAVLTALFTKVQIPEIPSFNSQETHFYHQTKFDKIILDGQHLKLYLTGEPLIDAGDLSGGNYFMGIIEKAVFQFDFIDKLSVYLNGQPYDFKIYSLRDNPPSKFWVTTREEFEQKDGQYLKDRMTIKVPKYSLSTETYKPELFWETFQVPKSPQVLTATYEKLLGDIFDSVSIKNKVAKLKLKGDEQKLAEILDLEHWNPRAMEIVEAAFQFPTVDALEVYLNGELIDWCNYEMADESESGCDTNNHFWKITKKDWKKSKILWSTEIKNHFVDCPLNMPNPIGFCNPNEKFIVVERDTRGCALKYGCEPIQLDFQKIIPIVTLILKTDNEELKSLLLAILIQIIKG